MNISKEFMFFAYLLESYSAYKDTTASEVLKTLCIRRIENRICTEK